MEETHSLTEGWAECLEFSNGLGGDQNPESHGVRAKARWTNWSNRDDLIAFDKERNREIGYFSQIRTPFDREFPESLLDEKLPNQICTEICSSGNRFEMMAMMMMMIFLVFALS